MVVRGGLELRVVVVVVPLFIPFFLPYDLQQTRVFLSQVRSSVVTSQETDNNAIADEKETSTVSVYLLQGFLQLLEVADDEKQSCMKVSWVRSLPENVSTMYHMCCQREK